MPLGRGKFLPIFVKGWSKRRHTERKGTVERVCLALLRVSSLHWLRRRDPRRRSRCSETGNGQMACSGGSVREARTPARPGPNPLLIWMLSTPLTRIWGASVGLCATVFSSVKPPYVVSFCSIRLLTLASPHPQSPWTQPDSTWLCCHFTEMDFKTQPTASILSHPGDSQQPLAHPVVPTLLALLLDIL